VGMGCGVDIKKDMHMACINGGHTRRVVVALMVTRKTR
jgi:hypothetical protein